MEERLEEPELRKEQSKQRHPDRSRPCTQELTRLHKTKPTDSRARMGRAGEPPSLAPSADGCWGRKSRFSLEAWPLVGWPHAHGHLCAYGSTS